MPDSTILPALYHAHHLIYNEDLPFWIELALQQGGAVLELGCGTGRVLLPLAQMGIPMTGIDNDPDMLTFLRQGLPENLQPTLRIEAADMTDFDLGQSFSLVISPCNTWSTLSAAERAAALGCIARHLEPGGVFAFSVPGPHLLRELPARSDLKAEEDFPYGLDGEMLQVSSGWRRGKTHFTVNWQYDLLQADGAVQRFTAKAQHCLASVEDYQAEARAAGFTVSALYGDFEQSPYDEESDTLIMVCGI